MTFPFELCVSERDQAGRATPHALAATASGTQRQQSSLNTVRGSAVCHVHKGKEADPVTEKEVPPPSPPPPPTPVECERSTSAGRRRTRNGDLTAQKPTTAAAATASEVAAANAGRAPRTSVPCQGKERGKAQPARGVESASGNFFDPNLQAGTISGTNHATTHSKPSMSADTARGRYTEAGVIALNTRNESLSRTAMRRVPPPTADKLNDPIFRAKAKAKAKAKARAAKAATAVVSGGAVESEGCQKDTRRTAGICAGHSTSRASCKQVQQRVGGGSESDRRNERDSGGWMSSRRQDWGLDYVHPSLAVVPDTGRDSSPPQQRKLARTTSTLSSTVVGPPSQCNPPPCPGASEAVHPAGLPQKPWPGVQAGRTVLAPPGSLKNPSPHVAGKSGGKEVTTAAGVGATSNEVRRDGDSVGVACLDDASNRHRERRLRRARPDSSFSKRPEFIVQDQDNDHGLCSRAENVHERDCGDRGGGRGGGNCSGRDGVDTGRKLPPSVGPRSYARKRSGCDQQRATGRGRADERGMDGQSQDAATSASKTAAVVAVVARVALDEAALRSPSKPRPKTADTSPLPYRPKTTAKDNGEHEADPTTSSGRRRRSCRGDSERDHHAFTAPGVARAKPGCAIASPPPRARQQQQPRAGARGQEMMRQASDQAKNADGCTASTAAAGATTKNSLRKPAARSRRPFSGLSFVFVGLPERLSRDLEVTAVCGGGLLSKNISMIEHGCGGGGVDAHAEVAPACSRTHRSKRRKQGANAAAEVVIVAVSLPAASRLPEYILAVAAGIPLLHHLWISDSMSRGRAVHAASYLLPGARETSRRRQAVYGGGRAAAGPPTSGIERERSARGREELLTVEAGVEAAEAAAAREAVSKVVAKPGTPLIGMTIGIAHPSTLVCEIWARVLLTAGAQGARQISDATLGGHEDGEERSMAMEERASSRTRSLLARERVRRSQLAGKKGSEKADGRGDDGDDDGHVHGAHDAGRERDALLLPALTGLDCVLCDFPGTWLYNHRKGSSPCASSSLPTGLLLDRVVAAARHAGTPVVSLSWAVECVLRGTRVSQQSLPEYTSLFGSLAGDGRPGDTEGQQGRSILRGTNDVVSRFSSPLRTFASGVGVPSPTDAKALSPRSGCSSFAAPRRLHAFVSQGADGREIRYEVNDYVHFCSYGVQRSEAFAVDSSRRRNDLTRKRIAPGCTAVTAGRGKKRSARGLGGSDFDPNDDGNRNGNESGDLIASSWEVGRIVLLERAAQGRIFATLDLLQTNGGPLTNMSSTAANTKTRGRERFRFKGGGGGAGGAAARVGSGRRGVFVAQPSTESSVARGRVRRARELETVMERSAGNRNQHGYHRKKKVDVSCLIGRVTVLTAREFDARQGYCGRDGSVYAWPRRAARSGGII